MRSDRRKAINRPKRSIKFALENNKTRLFRTTDIVNDQKKEEFVELAKSADRNKPSTPGRLIKLLPSS